MKKTIRNKVFAGILAAMCAVSAVTVMSVVSASAQSNISNAPSAFAGNSVIVKKTAGSEFTLPIRGYDWNYYAESLNAKITCEFDYQYNVCNFIITAVKPGITNAVLKTQEVDGQWSNTPVRITVNKDMTMKLEQTGNAFLTASDRTTGSSPSTSGTSVPAPTETTVPAQTETSAAPRSGKTVHFPVTGTNWNYYANTLNAKITCDFDYSKSLCDFVITAVKPGVTDAVLKVQRADGKWENIPVHITVDNALNLTVKQSGSTYVTEKSYTA